MSRINEEFELMRVLGNMLKAAGKGLAFAAVVFTPVLLWAGTTGKIAGVVRDAETGDPLPGVNVVIVGTTMGAATGPDGSYFIINVPPGTYAVKAQMIGYQPVVQKNVLVRVDLTTEVNFRLQQTAIEMGEVVVVAEKPLVQKDITSGRAIVTADQIKELPVENFADVLKTKAGIVEGASGAIHVRGGRAGEVAYMIDGIPVDNPFWGGSTVLVENTAIQELQVVSGTFNAEYGQAMSGVVNIVTKDGGPNYHGQLSIYAGDRVSTHKDVFENIEALDPLNVFNTDVSLSGPVPFTGKRVRFFASSRLINDRGYLYGKREHLPGDVLYLDSLTVINLANSPYGTQLNFNEPYTDANGNGKYDPGEPFLDYNQNGRRDNGFSGDGRYVPMNPYRRFSLQTKLTFRISPSLQFRYSLLFNDRKYKSYSHNFKYNPEGIPNRYSWGASHTLDLTHTLSPSTFYTLKAARYEYDYKSYLYKDWRDPRYLPNVLLNTPGHEFYAGGQSKTHTYRNSRSYVVRFDLTSQVNRRHQIKTGFEARAHRLWYHSFYIDIRDTYDWVPTIHTPEASTSNNQYLRKPYEGAYYVQDKIELADMIVNIGVRFDYFNANWYVPADPRDKKLIAGNRKSLSELKLRKVKPKMQWSPRLGIAYPITDRGIIHFSYGHFFQMPGFAYLYSNPEFEVISGRFRSNLGNADLKPERTVQYELGLQQQLGRDIGMEVIAFYKDINDLLGTEVVELYSRGDYYTRYTNADYGHVKGITISLEKRRTGLLSATLDYTYSVAEGNSSDPLSRFYDLQTVPPRESPRRALPLDWDQRHTLNATVSLTEPNKWGVSLLARMGSGLPYTPEFQGARLDVINSGRKPPRYNFDLHAYRDFHLNKLRLSLFLKVYNLFDQLNENYVYNDTGRATYSLIPTYVPDHGDEYGRHHLKDYLNRPHWYSQPRQVFVGLSLGF